ncbi:bifunctional phosphoribosyl-AMP cyclohydrolase/phosphoribosyl-ATP diphosphatase HisIE [Alkalibacterium sp. 20]|uniref:bifunctional phosphoribosyl-AMP cyclohydrolase/phosphoribosyl-ATP diphosphatase HisIE n=1 Tax=Alkalibacterium sp. 20 TaxID=1798803 RepID=UPI0009002FA4|nr:bifunctional phosphoribosyl-AMP cyclohydrolase/phosphoribosyl-ATP diphosphatase HisIE [Alkalibacterium sp. 20]OJF94147.1 bifunctional phosphoribosyl-AMP cyclohydrolase/phosphoribosyl-ATP diphosphatase [Alkalibacterium sp. 20]
MSKYNSLQPDFSKGLLPVILQHYTTKDVRMVGYMNEEAFEQTKKDEVVWFFSRSKNRLWKKGETSGNVQFVKDMYLDCDQDALLVMIDPVGPTCHTGSKSCFNLGPSFTLKDIEASIQARDGSGEEKSYTNYLLSEGIDKIAKKFGEEAFEVVIGAKNNNKEEVANEAADVLYHLGVLLYQTGVSISDVETVLASRHEKQNNFKGERKDVNNW